MLSQAMALSMSFIRLLLAASCCPTVSFFFSSRRRHTRCGRDWSSDVCSSDLPLTVVVIVFIAVIGAPFVEELFFRGLVMSGLVSRWGAAIGIISQAVLFGVVHLGPTDARGNLGVFLLIAPLGAMLGVLRYGYKRLGPGMFTHAFY